MKLLRVAVVALVQAAALAGLIGVHAYTLETGTPVVLRTVPVDPRELFRGDVVILTYDISNVEAPPRLAGAAGNGDEIWAVLVPSGGRLDPWKLDRLSLTRPETQEDEVALRGEVRSIVSRPVAPATEPETVRETTLRVQYGIERYFVPGGTRGELEKLRDGDRLMVEVKVGNDGRAVLSALIVDGERIAEKTIF